MTERTVNASRQAFMGLEPTRLITALKMPPTHASAYARAVRVILRGMTQVRDRSASEPFTVKDFQAGLKDYRPAYDVWDTVTARVADGFNVRSRTSPILAPALVIMRYQQPRASKFFRDALLRDGIVRGGLQDRLGDLLLYGRARSQEGMEETTIQMISYWNAFYIGRPRAYQTNRYEDGLIIYGTPFVPADLRVMHQGVYINIAPVDTPT